MKYLRKFATEAEYKAFAESEYEAPNVSLLADSGVVKYNLLLGTFIQHIDGTLYTTDKWAANGFSSELANGVAVCTPQTSFVIAKNDVPGTFAWGGYLSDISGVLMSSDPALARQDYDGLGNTSKILAQLKTSMDLNNIKGAPAAEACANFMFPNGKLGYLPAAGEWSEAYKNKEEIDEALSLIGGTALIDSTPGYKQVSTQRTNQSTWIFWWKSGSIANSNRSDSAPVRAFTTIE